MSKYVYKGSTTVDEVNFIQTENGGIRGYLHARDDAPREKLNATLEAMHEQGWETIPFTLDGKHQLEIRGIKDEKQLIHTLKNKELVSKDETKQDLESDNISLWDKFKKRTLQASGAAYIVGDYGFWNYGRKEADTLVMAGAVSYFLGTLSLIFYGKNDQSNLQVQDMAKDLQKFLAQDKIPVPDNCALHKITDDKDHTTLQKLDDFCRRYPSEIFNTVTALAGVFVAASAYKNKVMFKPTAAMDLKAIKEMRHEGWLDFGLGATTTASGLLATLVKEKKPDPDDPPAKGLNWVWQQVQAHPLAIAGGGYTISTMFHAFSTYKAYKEAKRVGDTVRLASVPNRALFVGAALVSEFLLAISSKGHGEGVTSDDSVKESVYNIAAELIIKQPKEERAWHVQHVAGFLQQPQILAESFSDVEKELYKRIAEIEKNPWLCQPNEKEQNATHLVPPGTQHHAPEAAAAAMLLEEKPNTLLKQVVEAKPAAVHAAAAEHAPKEAAATTETAAPTAHTVAAHTHEKHTHEKHTHEKHTHEKHTVETVTSEHPKKTEWAHEATPSTLMNTTSISQSAGIQPPTLAV